MRRGLLVLLVAWFASGASACATLEQRVQKMKARGATAEEIRQFTVQSLGDADEKRIVELMMHPDLRCAAAEVCASMDGRACVVDGIPRMLDGPDRDCALDSLVKRCDADSRAVLFEAFENRPFSDLVFKAVLSCPSADAIYLALEHRDFTKHEKLLSQELKFLLHPLEDVDDLPVFYEALVRLDEPNERVRGTSANPGWSLRR